MHLIGWLSLHHYFWSFDLFFHLGHISLSQHISHMVRGEALGIHQGRATHFTVLWCCLWGRGLRGTNATCSALGWLSVTSPTTQKQIGADSLGEWACVHSHNVHKPTCVHWFSPMGSPVSLGVCPTVATSTGFCSQGFWGFIFLYWNHGLCCLSRSSVVLPGLSTHKCGTRSASHHLTGFSRRCLARSPLHCSCLSLPLLPVSMNDSSLTPWLSGFYTVWFSGSSGYFLLLNLLSFFSLCQEAKCIYLHLHLGQKKL